MFEQFPGQIQHLERKKLFELKKNMGSKFIFFYTSKLDVVVQKKFGPREKEKKKEKKRKNLSLLHKKK